MPKYAFAILLASWIAWCLPFFLARKGQRAPQLVDRRARWGIVLVFVAYALIWFGPFWLRTPSFWRIPLAIPFLLLAPFLSWAAVRALSRHWRIDAGLDKDHQLIRTGPYRFIRHPIYTSMLLQLLGTGLLISIPWLIPIAVALFLAGTEIRIRIEDKLLADRFGETFTAYARSTSAYIPFLK